MRCRSRRTSSSLTVFVIESAGPHRLRFRQRTVKIVGVLRLRRASLCEAATSLRMTPCHNNSLQFVDSKSDKSSILVVPVLPVVDFPGSASCLFHRLSLARFTMIKKHPPAAVRHPIAMVQGSRRFSMKSIYCTLILLLAIRCCFRGAGSGLRIPNRPPRLRPASWTRLRPTTTTPWRTCTRSRWRCTAAANWPTKPSRNTGWRSMPILPPNT